MKKRILNSLGIVVILFSSGCASMPKMPPANEGILMEKGLKEVHTLAEDALVVNGFDITKNTDEYLQGKRPNKMGLFVGSGGEIVGIWLQPINENQTKVFIKNKKTAMGYVGQKNWEADVRKEMLGVEKWK